MTLSRLGSLIVGGTGLMAAPVLLADGHAFSVRIAAGADLADSVCLWPALDALGGEDWKNEAPGAGFPADGLVGQEFHDVPVRALYELAGHHGGEIPAAADDTALTAPLVHLRTAGIRCIEAGGHNGHYVRIPLADGTQITFAGTTTSTTHDYPDVSVSHPVREHHSWSAQWSDGLHVLADIHTAANQPRPYIDDTADLVAVIRDWANKSGGSAPQEGAGETALQLATRTLTERGITAHVDDDAGNTWLVIACDQTGARYPDMLNGPYMALSVYNGDEDVWAMDRPPVRPADRWHVLLGDGTGTHKTLVTRPTGQLDHCVTVIADWLAKPRS